MATFIIEMTPYTLWTGHDAGPARVVCDTTDRAREFAESVWAPDRQIISITEISDCLV